LSDAPSFRQEYLERLNRVAELTYDEFGELYAFFFDNVKDGDFSEEESAALDEMNEQFDMTTNLQIGGEDRDLGWITYLEFKKIVVTDILPQLKAAKS
jgi:hypothetical protein